MLAYDALGALARKRPRGLHQAGLEIDIGRSEAVAVDHQLPHDRERGRIRVFHLPDHRAEVEGELGVEFAGELLHALVFRKAADMQELDSAIARGKQAAFEQRRADAEALPGLLDAECGFGLAPIERPENAQIRGAAQHAVHEEAVHDDVAAVCRCRIGSNHIVGDRASETITAAFSVEPEQMIAIGVRLDAP